MQEGGEQEEDIEVGEPLKQYDGDILKKVKGEREKLVLSLRLNVGASSVIYSEIMRRVSL